MDKRNRLQEDSQSGGTTQHPSRRAAAFVSIKCGCADEAGPSQIDNLLRLLIHFSFPHYELLSTKSSLYC